MFCFLQQLQSVRSFTYSPAMSQQLTEPFSRGYEPTRPARPSLGCRVSHPCRVTLQQGRAVFDYAMLYVGQEGMDAVVRGGPLRLPRGGWPAFCKDRLRWAYSDALSKACRRALWCYLESLRKGALTTCGMLGDRGGHQKRSLNGWLNSLKCP